MKKILILTHINFWYPGSGDRARLCSLVKFLSKSGLVTIVYGGLETENDEKLIRALAFQFELVYLERREDIPLSEYQLRLARFLEQRTFDVGIVEYLELSFFMPVLKSKMKVILDTHDLYGERNRNFSKFGITPPVLLDSSITFTQQQEFDTYKSYDAVMAISSQDYSTLTDVVGRERTILAPHPCDLSPREIKGKVETIGFVASGYVPNLHAINFFINEVWPLVSNDGLRLEIYGTIGNRLRIDRRRYLPPGIVIKGFVDSTDDIYRNIDIVINPVQFGAGLKIKNVEALANCLPLITTPHGAVGFDGGLDEAFLVASNAREFAEKIMTLVDNLELRERLSEGARNFVKDSFSPDRCFGDLISFINNHN